MTFFLTFHGPLHNVPRSISPASLSTLFWDFLDTRFFSGPVTPAFMYPLYAPNYTCFSHLLFTALFTPMRRRETSVMEADRATFVYRKRASYRLTLNIYRPPLERARIYSKRPLIFQRKPAVLLRAKR